MLFGVTKKTLV